MKKPFRSEAEAYRFVIGTVGYFAAVVLATALGGRWWGIGVFVALSVLVLIWFFRHEASMFNVLLGVVLAAAVLIAVVLAVRALT